MMMRMVRVTLALSALVLAGASGTSSRNTPATSGGGGGGGGGDEIKSGWKVDAGTDQPLAGAFGNQARKYGCRTYNEDTWKVAAECREGKIVFLQEGRQVLVGCTIDEPQCKQLFSNIANAN